LNFIKSPEEYAIVTSIQKSVLVRNLQDSSGLAKVVAKWRAYLGIPKEGADPEELAIVIMYIKEHWDILTLSEIELAFTLSINRKLDDCEFFGFFSPNYVSKVLHAYMYYRKLALADALRAKEKFELEEAEKASRPTPEQECETTRELFLNFYEEFKKNGEINDPFNLAYNLLRKEKWMKVSESDINESLQQGKVKYQQERQKESLLRQVSRVMVITGRIFDIVVINPKVAQIVLKKKMNEKIVPVAISVLGYWKDRALNDMKLKLKDKIKANVYMKSKLYNGKYYTDVYFKEIMLVEEAPKVMNGSSLFNTEEGLVDLETGEIMEENNNGLTE